MAIEASRLGPGRLHEQLVALVRLEIEQRPVDGPASTIGGRPPTGRCLTSPLSGVSLLVDSSPRRQRAARAMLLEASWAGALGDDVDVDLAVDMLFGAVWAGDARPAPPASERARQVVDVVLAGLHWAC
jgi:hypothetical protein